jgi:hypothetical protein
MSAAHSSSSAARAAALHRIWNSRSASKSAHPPLRCEISSRSLEQWRSASSVACGMLATIFPHRVPLFCSAAANLA